MKCLVRAAAIAAAMAPAMAASTAALLLGGCGSPSQANIELRKQNQNLQNQIIDLQRQHDGDVAQIAALQAKVGAVPTLPVDRLNQLFTTHGLKLGDLTGGNSSGPNQKFDDELTVYAVPTDDDGEPIKAAGSFVIQAFDLALAGDQKIGEWSFDIDQTRKSWESLIFNSPILYNYALNCPWQKPPAHSDLTVKMTFTDALTGRVFSQQKQVHVTPPPADAGK
jgi:hypothetical protein